MCLLTNNPGVGHQGTDDVIEYCFELFSLDWDTVVREGLGNYFYFPDGYRTNNTNFRDLLAHRTGLSAMDSAGLFGELNRDEIIEYARARFSQDFIRTFILIIIKS